MAILAVLLVLTSCLSVSAVFSSSDQQVKSAYDKIMERDGFVYGVVIPWFSTGSAGGDFGEIQAAGLPCKYDRKEVEKTFYNCKSIGFQSVSIWLMRNMQGARFDSNGNVLGFDSYFLQNVEDMLKIAQEMDLHLILNINPHCSTGLTNYSKETYDLYMQSLFVPEKREVYLEKIIDPLLELFSKYEDTVLAVAPYVEPEGDVYGTKGSNSSWGTTWENMADYIRAVAQRSKKIMPDVPVTVGSGWLGYKPLSTGLYNTLGLDIIGQDVYNDHGDLREIKSLKVSKPVWLTEYGPATSDNYSDDFQMYYVLNFLNNAQELGYKGAFIYLNGSEDQSSQGFKKYDGSVRPVVSALHFRILDNAYERQEIEQPIDKPGFYISGSNINWFASRGAEAYTLERSSDKKSWEVIGNKLDAVELDKWGNNICSYNDETAAEGQDYYYRVTAHLEDGTKIVSDPSCVISKPKSTCKPEENLLKNTDFETGDLTHFLTTGKDGAIEVISDPSGDNVHGGAHALHMSGSGTWEYVRQQTTCKPNTDYTFTLFAKATGSEKNVSCFKFLDKDKKDFTNNQIFVCDGEWHQYTITFNSKSNSTLYLYLGDGTTDVYIDDLYLFEAEN